MKRLLAILAVAATTGCMEPTISDIGTDKVKVVGGDDAFKAFGYHGHRLCL